MMKRDELRKNISYLKIKPILVGMAAIMRGRKKPTPGEYFLIASGVIFLLILIYWGVWSSARLFTMSADSFISRIGAPVLLAQVGLMLLSSLLFWLFCSISRVNKFIAKSSFAFDLIIFFVIWGITAWVWCSIPTLPQYAIRMPTAPNYEYYPFSDAVTYTLGAQKFITGFPDYESLVDKPLLIVYQIMINLVGGKTPNLAFYLNTTLLGAISAVLYLIGKELHHRVSGVGIAVLYILKESNVLLAAPLVYMTSNVKTLYSESLTGLFIALSVWLLIYWLKSPRNLLGPILAGGMLGLATLVRLNPAILFPIGPFLFWRVEGNFRKQWRLASGLFLAVFLLTQLPWAIFNQVSYGNPLAYIYRKTNVVVVEHRYVPFVAEQKQPTAATVPLPTSNNPVATSAVQPEQSSIRHFLSLGLYIVDRLAINSMTNLFVLPPRLTDNLQSMFGHYYWAFGVKAPGDFEAALTLILNFLLISTGIGYAWSRWKWAGLVPLLANIVYGFGAAITLTAAGFRSTVPVDWSALVYFSIGLLAFGRLIIHHGMELENKKITGGAAKVVKPIYFMVVGAFILVAATPVFVYYLFPPRKIPTQSEMRQSLMALDAQQTGKFDPVINLDWPRFNYYYGLAIDPRFYEPGQGDNTEKAGMFNTRSYSRILFDFFRYYENTGKYQYSPGVTVDMAYPSMPKHFPNNSEVIVVTCGKDNFTEPILVAVWGEEKEIYKGNHFNLLQCMGLNYSLIFSN